MSIIDNKGLLQLNDDSGVATFTYINESDGSRQNNISQADIVFEYLGLNDRTIYTAIFKNKPLMNSNPLTGKRESLSKFIPKLNFSSNIDLENTYSKPASSIFVTFNEYTSSNFIYSDGYYYHFKDTIKDMDDANASEVMVSNIIVQFVDDISFKDGINGLNGTGTGLIFSHGKGSEIEWTKKKNSPIKLVDINNDDITLLEGHTWWIIINKNSPVVFN